MRILYGVHTQGQGGLAKASILVPRMEALGHEVRIVTSGVQPPACYQFTWQRHVPGMEYVVADGRADSLARIAPALRGSQGGCGPRRRRQGRAPRPRLQTQLSHQVKMAAMCAEARKFRASLS